MIFSAITPPASSERAPIMSGSITLSCTLRIFAAVVTALKISLLVTSVYIFLWQTSQSRLSSVPLFIRMWCDPSARDAKAPLLPVDSWYKVCPILPFFWFGMFSVSESASSSVFSDSCLEIIFPFFQKPASFNMNCFVLVDLTDLPFSFNFRGFVYYPLLRR